MNTTTQETPAKEAPEWVLKKMADKIDASLDAIGWVEELANKPTVDHLGLGVRVNEVYHEINRLRHVVLAEKENVIYDKA